MFTTVAFALISALAASAAQISVEVGPNGTVSVADVGGGWSTDL
jgi:hypothetical protein